MGRPQSGHFVASDEDFPEFKLPKVVRASLWVILQYIISHARVLPNTPPHPLLCMRAKLRSGRKDVLSFVTHSLPSLLYFSSQNALGRSIYYNTALVRRQKCSCDRRVLKPFSNTEILRSREGKVKIVKYLEGRLRFGEWGRGKFLSWPKFRPVSSASRLFTVNNACHRKKLCV